MDDQALRDYFEFDEADLSANRNGRFSDKQQKALDRVEKAMGIFFLGLGILALAIAVILIINIVLRGDIRSSISHVVGAVVCGCIGGFILYFQLFTKPTFKDVVKKVEGPIKFIRARKIYGERHTGSYLQLQLHIGQEKFILDIDKKKPADLIVPGDIYAVYFKDRIDPKTGESWRTEALLSVEWLSKGSATQSDAPEEDEQEGG